MEGLVDYFLEWELNGHSSQILSSRHLEQISPGLIPAIFMAVSSISISNDLVIGFPIYHANRRNVALPSCESSGVYAMKVHLLSVGGLQTCPVSERSGFVEMLSDWANMDGRIQGEK
jgi:hypothetical protein